jgi:hypothetical protein
VKRLLSIAVASVALFAAGCAKADLHVDTPEAGIGSVAAVENQMADYAAIFSDPNVNQDELRYGSLKLLKVTIDQNPYLVDWNEEANFASLKVGEKVNFRGNGQFVHVKQAGSGGVYRVVTVFR